MMGIEASQDERNELLQIINLLQASTRTFVMQHPMGVEYAGMMLIAAAVNFAGSQLVMLEAAGVPIDRDEARDTARANFEAGIVLGEGHAKRLFGKVTVQ